MPDPVIIIHQLHDKVFTVVIANQTRSQTNSPRVPNCNCTQQPGRIDCRFCAPKFSISIFLLTDILPTQNYKEMLSKNEPDKFNLFQVFFRAYFRVDQRSEFRIKFCRIFRQKERIVVETCLCIHKRSNIY